MESEELILFEQEVIQSIIDYKWDTYAYKFSIRKFFLYCIFLAFFIWDLETLCVHDENHNRIKDWAYWLRKICGFLIALYFFLYEILQITMLKEQYFTDLWNYFEVLGILFYWSASAIDVLNDEITDSCRILFVICLMFSLIKVLYLIRVFKSLSFLVKMLTQVILDLEAFFILLSIFIFVTAQSFTVMDTDMSSYGRLPTTVAQIISTFRLAFGEFTVIDPYVTFDYKDEDDNYTRSFSTVFVTFLIFIISSIFLYLMLMNFIIAVICESYAKVKKYAVAHDYK